jgi:hypothetical protein
MTDAIAQAAADMAAAPSSTEPVTGNVLVNETPAGEQGNVNAAAGSQPAADTTLKSSEQPATNEAPEAMPRESHLMLLEHKLTAMHAKFKTGERIVIDEFESILGHIRAVL